VQCGQALANRIALHISQIREHGAGSTQPTLDALLSLARALHVSLNAYVFGEAERGPSQEMRVQFEAVSEFTSEDNAAARSTQRALDRLAEASQVQSLGRARACPE
jgi:hypothetical protein